MGDRPIKGVLSLSLSLSSLAWSLQKALLQVPKVPPCRNGWEGIKG